MVKKYPVGTKIRYIGSCIKCRNQVGKIVEIFNYNCYIALPQSTCGAFTLTCSIICGWDDIEPLVVKGEQLLFEFMVP